MQNKHTPGPWQTNGSQIFHQRNPGGLRLWVAETLQGNDTIQQREANARLIAAAPELLEALRHTLSRLAAETKDVEACDLYPSTVAAMEEAKAAIAKAVAL